MKILHKGQPIKEGDVIKSFRGEEWIFISLSNNPTKVVVSGPVKDRLHNTREYFIGVFDITLEK